MKMKSGLEILHSFPISLLVEIPLVDLVEIFGINKGYMSQTMTKRLKNEPMKQSKLEWLMKDEKELLYKGAWMKSEERKFIKQFKNLDK